MGRGELFLFLVGEFEHERVCLGERDQRSKKEMMRFLRSSRGWNGSGLGREKEEGVAS